MASSSWVDVVWRYHDLCPIHGGPPQRKAPKQELTPGALPAWSSLIRYPRGGVTPGAGRVIAPPLDAAVVST